MTQSISPDSTELAAANQRNLRRLVVSVQASLHKLNLLIAICDNPRYRDELIRTYEAELTAKGIACYQIQLDRQQPSLKQSLLNWQTHTPAWHSDTPTLVTVRGGDELYDQRLKRGIAVDRPQEEARAIAAFQSAIARRESLTDPTPLATSLNNLASLYQSQGHYSEAEPLYERSLLILEKKAKGVAQICDFFKKSQI